MSTRSFSTGTPATLMGALTLVFAAASGAPAQTPDPAPAPAPGVQDRQERMERMRELRGERLERLQELRQQRAPATPGIERILEQRARLGLTDSQVNALNTLRVQALETRQARMATLARVRSDLAAGEITRAEAAARMEQLRSEAEATPLQARVQEILTEDQRTQLQESRRALVGREGMRRNPLGPGPRGPMDRRPRQP